MSVEDSDFLSDESDYDANEDNEQKIGEDDDENFLLDYLELVQNSLLCFQHVHYNCEQFDVQVGLLMFNDRTVECLSSESVFRVQPVKINDKSSNYFFGLQQYMFEAGQSDDDSDSSELDFSAEDIYEDFFLNLHEDMLSPDALCSFLWWIGEQVQNEEIAYTSLVSDDENENAENPNVPEDLAYAEAV